MTSQLRRALVRTAIVSLVGLVFFYGEKQQEEAEQARAQKDKEKPKDAKDGPANMRSAFETLAL